MSFSFAHPDSTVAEMSGGMRMVSEVRDRRTVSRREEVVVVDGGEGVRWRDTLKR